MKNPPNYGSIINLGKNRRRPIAVRVPNGKKIDRVKFQDVQDIADSINGMSASTVANVKTVLFETFDLARKQKYITENFINDVDFLYKKNDGKIHSSFSRDEVALLWEHSSDKNAQIVLIMIYTGLRIEELLSMKMENVHLNEKYMVGGVKTDAGKDRIIPIADKILPFIQIIYNPKSQFLLNHGLKRYSRTNFLYSIWEPAMFSLNLGHLSHDTRYTCASMMDRAGVNENCKKMILGHAKKGITNQVYVEKDLQDLLDAINMI